MLLFNSGALLALRVRLTTSRLPFTYIPSKQVVSVFDYELPRELRKQAERLFQRA
jgi:hypothetical protein